MSTAANTLVGCYGFSSPPSNPALLSNYITVASDGVPASVSACAQSCALTLAFTAAIASSPQSAVIVVGQLLNRFVCGCAQNLTLFYQQDPSSCENKCPSDSLACGSTAFSNRFSIYSFSSAVAVSSSASSTASASFKTASQSQSLAVTTSSVQPASETSSSQSAGTGPSQSDTLFLSQKYAVPLLVSLAVLVAICVAFVFVVARRRRRFNRDADLPQLSLRPMDPGFFSRRSSKATTIAGGDSRSATLDRDVAMVSIGDATSAARAAAAAIGAADSLSRSLRRKIYKTGSTGRMVQDEDPFSTAVSPEPFDDDAFDADGYGSTEAHPPNRFALLQSPPQQKQPSTQSPPQLLSTSPQSASTPASPSTLTSLGFNFSGPAGGFLIANVLAKTPNMKYDAVRPHTPDPRNPYKGVKAGGASELTLSSGDVIKVACAFNDGWALGLNEATGESGYFPLECLISDSKASP
ncbi:hypothetical protein DFJ73DRAFT_808368 [Zopfochytrium polystomum]|nr:hypothetical protein DFJ73DRAFT_808368 [Zopfochytrium polystomum]